MTLKVLIEIPEGSSVKYELDETTHELTVDRLLPVAMSYPVSYGLIHDTLGEDGDALDALVFVSAPLIPGVIIKCKPIGLLEMEDEAGIDHKILCVPETTKIDPLCGSWESLDDIPESKKRAIRHFFEHYKDLEEGKWVKLKNWQPLEVAAQVIESGLKRFKTKN
jgi:inorganic pyrophosphatase